MEHRESGLIVIRDRIKVAKEELGLTTFRRDPVESIEEKDLTTVFMLEGTDLIIQRSSRDGLGYPCRRELEVFVDVVALAGEDIRLLYRNVRSYILPRRTEDSKSGSVLIPAGAGNNGGCSVMELRSVGPRNYGKPNVIGMQMVLSMTYTDNGT